MINIKMKMADPDQVTSLMMAALQDEGWQLGGLDSMVCAGMVSFIDPSKVQARPIRGRKTWGHSWFEAGFHHVGYTKGGLWAFQMFPDEIEMIGSEEVA